MGAGLRHHAFRRFPVTSPFHSEQIAYTALFEYRDASKSDPGSESFRVVNGCWLRTIRKSSTSGAALMHSSSTWRCLTASTSGLPCRSSPACPSRLRLLHRQPDRRPPIQPGQVVQHAVDEQLPAGRRRAGEKCAVCRDLCRLSRGWRSRQRPERAGGLWFRQQQSVRPAELYRPAAARSAQPLRHPGSLDTRRITTRGRTARRRPGSSPR